VTRGKYALLASAMLVLFLAAKVTDLDLGGFGIGLLILAAVFGLLAVVTPSQKGSVDG
jgi:hypothetical protein